MQAYELGDVQASIAVHDNLPATEKHSKMGERIKSIVYGGMDGIITTFAVVAGASGGSLGADVVLILGLSNVFAVRIFMSCSLLVP